MSLKRSTYGLLTAFMFAAAMSHQGELYHVGVIRMPKQNKNPMTPEHEKEILEKMEKELHDFNINGTIIRAKNRKTAIKIYNNRKGTKQ